MLDFAPLAGVRPADLRLLGRRDLCPCCGSTSSASVITANFRGQTGNQGDAIWAGRSCTNPEFLCRSCAPLLDDC